MNNLQREQFVISTLNGNTEEQTGISTKDKDNNKPTCIPGADVVSILTMYHISRFYEN